MIKVYPPIESRSNLANTGIDAVRGKGDFTVVHKFGRNESIGTTFEPISIGGIYQTPTSAVSLEFVSNAAADALNGAGMHELTVVGLDANWDEQTTSTAAHATDGTTAVSISGTWLRVYRAYVSSSGTYASSSAGSHSGDITVRVASAGATYATIDDTNFPRGQSQIGAYTVPTGYTAYVSGANITVDTNQSCDLIFFQRPSADDTSSSYSGTMRTVFEIIGVQGVDSVAPVTPFGPFVGPCDIGFMGRASATATAEVDFEILLLPT